MPPVCHLSWQYWDGEDTHGKYGRDNFLQVRHPSRNRTEAQCSGSLNLAAPVCAELVCVAALSAHVSRWACVVAESVQSVPRKEEAVGGGHDEGQVRGCNLSVIFKKPQMSTNLVVGRDMCELRKWFIFYFSQPRLPRQFF